MWVIIKVVGREMIHVSNEDTKEEANETIYNGLLEWYNKDVDKMNKDIESRIATICDSDMYAWSNRGGNYDIKAFWV